MATQKPFTPEEVQAKGGKGMSRDLYLFPFDADYPTLHCSQTVLSCDRHAQCFATIALLPSQDVPQPFMAFGARDEAGEMAYGPVTTTPYGEPLQYVTCAQLNTIAWEYWEEMSRKNQAIWSYLGCLPPETKVALYWC